MCYSHSCVRSAANHQRDCRDPVWRGFDQGALCNGNILHGPQHARQDGALYQHQEVRRQGLQMGK